MKIEQAKHDAKSAQRAFDAAIERAEDAYKNVLWGFYDAVKPSDAEAAQNGFEDADELYDALLADVSEEERVNPALEALNKIADVRTTTEQGKAQTA